MNKQSGFAVTIFFLGLLMLSWGPAATAYEGFNDCAGCHSSIANLGPAHGTHAALANSDCNTCHADGRTNNPPLSACVQCHGREADGGGDNISAGIGRGLRQHHVVTGAAACGSCHSDSTGPAGVGEDVLPAFYASALNSVGLDTCDGSEENFASESVSLDNDGDGLTDTADPDCAANEPPLPPIADANGPYAGTVGTPITFDGAGSSDPDGSITAYAWNFGDGGTGTGATPTHTYSVDGLFTVTLTVTDNDGQSASDTSSATINPAGGNTPPVASANGPYTGTEGVAVQFSSAGSMDADGNIVAYSWDFGDGNLSSAENPAHAYIAAGNYTVTLTVTDNDGDTSTDSTSATIEAPAVNTPPVADAGGPYSGFVGDAILFDGRASTDTDGAIVRYDWDYGDGATADDAGPAPSHAYAAAGNYTVTVTVTDDMGATGSATAAVVVSDPVPLTDGEAQYNSYCSSCHGDPWMGPAVDSALLGLRRVTGSRSCVIDGSIFGTYVFPDGVPEMQFLQGLVANGSIDSAQLAEYLNSQQVSGEAYYVSACAGCHGNDGTGGRTREGVRGEDAGEIREAIHEESTMRYLACLPNSDIDAIAAFLGGGTGNSDDDHDEEDDDDHERDSGGGGSSLLFLALLAMSRLFPALVRRSING